MTRSIPATNKHVESLWALARIREIVDPERPERMMQDELVERIRADYATAAGPTRSELVAAVRWLSDALAAYDQIVVTSEAVRRDRGPWAGWYDLSITGGAVDVQADRLVAWGFWERHDEHAHLVRPVVVEVRDE